MAFRISVLTLSLGLLLLARGIISKDVFYVFKPGYFCGAPDGVTVCHILGVNWQFPGPTIEATIGDTLHITVVNNIQRLPGQGPKQPATTVHWHGLFQNGTQFEDGPEGVTQCPIPEGNLQEYVFPLRQSGTYW